MVLGAEGGPPVRGGVVERSEASGKVGVKRTYPGQNLCGKRGHRRCWPIIRQRTKVKDGGFLTPC